MVVRKLLDECVHCGFCLPACPTYQLDGQEMDSPRGRIYLMGLAEQGEIVVDQTFTRHIDACLGCMACVTACPSGVQYDRLLAATRPEIERTVRRDRSDRAFRWLLFQLFPHPARLRLAALLGLLYRRSGLRALLRRAGILRRLPARLRAAEELLPQVPVRRLFTRTASVTPAAGTRRMRVAMLTGCAQRVLFSHVNAATVRVLAAEGCEVVVPRDQRCCGALSWHAGREPEARRRAIEAIRTFELLDVDAIVVNVAGCGSAMKEYDRLLGDDPAYGPRAARLAAKVRDVTELLAELPPVATRHPVPARVAYHDACHLAHAQRIRQQPRDLLRAIPGVELVEIAQSDTCCGSAGIYNLVQPVAAQELGRRKADSIEAAEPDIVATANAGCLLQIGRYVDRRVRLMHPVEIIDASISGATAHFGA